MRCRFLLPRVFLLSVALGGAISTTWVESSARETTAALQFISAEDVRFRYEGRIDFADRAAPVIVWEGSRIALDFDGSQLVLCWSRGTGQNFFNVAVDGQNEVISVPATGSVRTIWPHSLASGRHHLTLFKRTEASAGQIAFEGVEIGAGQQGWAPKERAYKLRMEFQGDSITVGACDEDGEKDQWDDRRTHNFAVSYATLIAAEFSADLRCEAVSGIGVVTGWIDINAAQMWDRIYPKKNSARADPAWQPDVLLVNLGDNDDDFPRSHRQPFPAAFTSEYVKLIRAMRVTNPHAHIVLLTGGMYGGSQSVPLREAWIKAVRQLESGDAAISHFVFTHWSSSHPRVADHRILANELSAWLKEQPFMQSLL